MIAQPDQDLVAFVRPLQGTDSHFDFSYGNCLPLVSRPFGMTNWCPQTDEGRLRAVRTLEPAGSPCIIPVHRRRPALENAVLGA